MTKRVTIQDIAQELGVTKSTVSRALNDNPRIGPALRAKIQQVARDLNYIPNGLAKSLAQGSSKTIGLVVLDIMNPFFAEFARGAENYALKHGYNLMLCNSDGKTEREKIQINLLIEKRVSGLILSVVNPNASHFVNLLKERYPMVFLDKFSDYENVSYVSVDGVVGGRIATRHLLEIGHTRIGHIAGPRVLAAHGYRLKGYKEALQEYGVAFDPLLVQTLKDTTQLEGYNAMKRFLSMDPEKRPTAIFAFNDIIALGAYRAVAEQGLKIPDDISLIGYDDIELASLLPVPLTTVHQPTYDQGKMAAKLLLEILSDPKKGIARHIIMEPSLVVRKSTRPLY